MKLMKKIATLLLCICLTVPCFSMMALAVDGKVSFSDPTAEAGEEFTVVVTVQVDAGVSNLDFTMDYDPAMVEFLSAPNANKVSDGKVEYSYELNQNSLLRGYDIAFTFKALQEGSTQVKISTYDIGSSFDISWVLGASTITIGNGATTDEPTTDEPTTDEPTTDEPTTDEPTTDATVEDGAQVVISNTTTITIIEDVTNIILPAKYAEATVTVEGVPYPAWQDTENPELFIVYAKSTSGLESLYQYDTLENTYQRFTAPEEVVVPEESEDNAILAFIDDNFMYVAIGAAALVLILLIIVIALSVKLHNRDAELDEVYDDLDEALAEKANLKKELSNKPVAAPAPVETEETVDDVVLTAEEEAEEDDDEVEVEFYVDESAVELVKEDNKLVEELPKEIEKAESVEEPVVETIEEPVAEEVKAEEEDDDLEDDFFAGLDESFMVDFIDLDD